MDWPVTFEKNRIQKVLESSNVKLSTVISNVFDVSGRKLLNRLIEKGYVDVKDVEERIHGRMASKKQQISDLLFDTINDHQLFLIPSHGVILNIWNVLLPKLNKELMSYCRNIKKKFNYSSQYLELKKDTAAVIIAEIGVDMSRFPTSQHLASWAGVCPGNKESAGKRYSTRTVKGSPHIKSAMCEAAWAVSRCRNKWLAAKYWSLAARRGKKKALVAISHRMLRII